MSAKKLSLLEAIFININIMLGTGTFVNTAVLAQQVGALGGFLYLGAGLLVLPLALCFSVLANIIPGGSFYSFGKTLGTYWGFMSTWLYFFGNLAGSSLSIHVFATFLQKVIPFLAGVPIFALDYGLLAFFISLNLLDVKTGSKIQWLFLVAKITPILFVVLLGLNYIDLIHIQAPHIIFDGVPVVLPLMLFCFLGFESTCALSRVIDKPEKNIPRVIIISFCIVLSLIFLYQTIFYLSMGAALREVSGYSEIFPLFLSRVMPKFASALESVVSTTIGIAALGGAYGTLYFNPWNLYTLAEENVIPGSRILQKTNTYGIPYWCVIAEGLVCLAYMIKFQGSQIPMQYTTTLCCVITYMVSMLGLIKIKPSLTSYVGFGICLALLYISVQGFLNTDLLPLYIVAGLAGAGTLMYAAKNRPFCKVMGYK